MSFREIYLSINPEGHQAQLDFLDTIDFLPYLKNGIRMDDLMRDIEDKYDYGPFKDKLPQELLEQAFCWMDQEDVANYLAERYNEYTPQYHEQWDSWYTLHKKEEK